MTRPPSAPQPDVAPSLASSAPDPFAIRTADALGALVGPVSEPARRKETTYVTAEYGAMIAASPFVVLATSGPRGLDVSPRGDPPGFVTVEDAHTLLLAERRGNNRVDGLRNLLDDSRVALFFLIPGVGETLRVSGRAEITIDPTLLARFAVGGRSPVSCPHGRWSHPSRVRASGARSPGAGRRHAGGRAPGSRDVGSAP